MEDCWILVMGNNEPFNNWAYEDLEEAVCDRNKIVKKYIYSKNMRVERIPVNLLPENFILTRYNEIVERHNHD